MQKLIVLALTAAVCSVLPASASAFVFFETACTDLGHGGADCTPPHPPNAFPVFITLALPGPTSSGTAFWAGDPSPPPAYTGDSFRLSIDGLPTLTSAFTGNGNVFHEQCLGNPRLICDFDISWVVTAGHLDDISIHFDTGDTNIGSARDPFGSFGLDGGGVFTDFPFSPGVGGCTSMFSGCAITGFWDSNLPVPEPGSLAILVTGFLGLLALRRGQPGRANRGFPHR